MKCVVLLTPNYGYNYLLHSLATEESQIELLICQSKTYLKNNGVLQGYLKLALRYSFAYFFVRFFEICIVSVISRLVLGKKNPFSLATLEKLDNVQFMHCENFESEEFIDAICKYKPELILSFTSHIIKDKLIKSISSPIVNFHPGFLPDYKGIAPYVWAMSHGASETGVSLNVIKDERIDMGDVVLISKVPLLPGDSIFDAYFRTIQIGLDLVILLIRNLDLLRCSKKQEFGTYYKWPDVSSLKSLKRCGYNIVSVKSIYLTIKNENPLNR